jgi:hypothetical protein
LGLSLPTAIIHLLQRLCQLVQHVL